MLQHRLCGQHQPNWWHPLSEHQIGNMKNIRCDRSMARSLAATWPSYCMLLHPQQKPLFPAHCSLNDHTSGGCAIIWWFWWPATGAVACAHKIHCQISIPIAQPAFLTLVLMVLIMTLLCITPCLQRWFSVHANLRTASTLCASSHAHSPLHEHHPCIRPMADHPSGSCQIDTFLWVTIQHEHDPCLESSMTDSFAKLWSVQFLQIWASSLAASLDSAMVHMVFQPAADGSVKCNGCYHQCRQRWAPNLWATQVQSVYSLTIQTVVKITADKMHRHLAATWSLLNPL